MRFKNFLEQTYWIEWTRIAMRTSASTKDATAEADQMLVALRERQREEPQK